MAEPDRSGFELFGGGVVRSVQRGSTVLSNDSEVQVTISQVDAAKSIILVNAASSQTTSDPTNYNVIGKIVNSNTISLKKRSRSTGTTVFWQVIEFENIASLQKGDFDFITDSSGFQSRTINISPVNLSKSILVFSFEAIHTATYGGNFGGELSAEDAITFYYRYGSAGAVIPVHWQVVEFN